MPTMNKADLLDCAAGHHDFSDDAPECHVCGHGGSASVPPPGATSFTVLLLYPDHMRDHDSYSDWVRRQHVNAETIEAAADAARRKAIAELFDPSDYDPPEPDDFAVVAVYRGHVDDVWPGD